MSTLFGGAGVGGLSNAANTGIGLANAANAIGGGGYSNFQQAMEEVQRGQMMKRFEIEEVENGVILHYRSKKYVCANMDEAFDRAKACLVQERMEK